MKHESFTERTKFYYETAATEARYTGTVKALKGKLGLRWYDEKHGWLFTPDDMKLNFSQSPETIEQKIYRVYESNLENAE